MPAFYSLSLIKALDTSVLYKLYMKNPFVGIVEMYRHALFKIYPGSIQGPFDTFHIVGIPIIFLFLILGLSIFFYKKHQKTLNDYLSY